MNTLFTAHDLLDAAFELVNEELRFDEVSEEFFDEFVEYMEENEEELLVLADKLMQEDLDIADVAMYNYISQKIK